MRIKIGISISLTLLAVVPNLNCRRESKGDEQLITDLNKALSLRCSKDPSEVELAKSTIKKIGDEAIPELRRILRSERGNRVGAMFAVRDLGSLASLVLFCEVMAGETLEAPHSGMRFCLMMVKENGWGRDELRTVPKFVPSALNSFEGLKYTSNIKAACELAIAADLKEALPIIIKWEKNAEPESRDAIREALKRLSSSHDP